MTTIIFLLEGFFKWSFGLLPILGNFPNILFIFISFALLFFWLYQTIQFEQEEQ